jgi:hypothetical protein
MQSLASYGLVALLLLLVQLGAVALWLYAVHDPSAASGESGLLQFVSHLSTPALVGSGLFLFGLYLLGALGIVHKWALEAFQVRLSRVAAGDLSLQFLPGWGDRSQDQTEGSYADRTARAARLDTRAFGERQTTSSRRARELPLTRSAAERGVPIDLPSSDLPPSAMSIAPRTCCNL